jgi:hypothetical protein
VYSTDSDGLVLFSGSQYGASFLSNGLGSREFCISFPGARIYRYIGIGIPRNYELISLFNAFYNLCSEGCRSFFGISGLVGWWKGYRAPRSGIRRLDPRPTQPRDT